MDLTTMLEIIFQTHLVTLNSLDNKISPTLATSFV
jgi:hypothetical protein